MNARYYTQGFAAAIYTDEPLNDNDTRMKFFLDELESIPGVEETRTGRYFVEMAFGYLFDPEKVLKDCLNLFSKVFQVEMGDRITEAERLQTLMEYTHAD